MKLAGWLADALLILGLVLFAVGAALISPALAIAIAGLECVALAVLLGTFTGRS